VNQRGQLIELAGAAENIHVRETLENVRPVALGHAADHADDHARVGRLARTELAEAGPDFLLGVFADGAGVEDDDVGGVAIIDRFVPCARSWPRTSSLSSTFIWQPKVSRKSFRRIVRSCTRNCAGDR
jgi:hypothetical protein